MLTWQRRRTLVLVVCVVGLMVSACGGGAQNGTDATATTSAGLETTATPGTSASGEEPAATTGTSGSNGFDLDGLADAAQDEGQLVWWTGMPSEMADSVAAAFTATYDIPVEIVRQPANPLFEKFTTEYQQGSRHADIFNVLNVPMLQDLKSRGWLEPIPAEFTESWSPGFVDPDNAWVSVRIDPVVVAVNTAAVDVADFESWDGIVETSASLGLVDPRINNGGYIWYFGLRDALEVDDVYFEGLASKNPRWYPETTAGANSLAAGEVAVLGNMLESRIVKLQAEEAPLAIAHPAEGLPIAIDAMGVIAEAPNPNAARLFMHFVTSDEGSQVVAEASWTYSANPTAESNDPTGERPKLEDLVSADIDWDRFFAETENYREEMYGFFGR